MGNQLSPPAKVGVEHQGELLNVVVKETLGEAERPFPFSAHGVSSANACDVHCRGWQVPQVLAVLA
jgi:hypothetical protein